jgi:hypothetical protein
MKKANKMFESKPSDIKTFKADNPLAAMKSPKKPKLPKTKPAKKAKIPSSPKANKVIKPKKVI